MRKLLLLGVLCTLSACVTVPDSAPKVEIRTVQVRPPAPIVPKVDQLNLRDVDFHVITIHNMEEKLAENPVYYGLNQEGYKALSLNTSDLLTNIQQQQIIIRTYERSYGK